MVRSEDGHDAQAARMAHRALLAVHPCQPLHQDGHGLGGRGRQRGGYREDRPAPCEFGRAPAVGEEPEVVDAHEAGRMVPLRWGMREHLCAASGTTADTTSAMRSSRRMAGRDLL